MPKLSSALLMLKICFIVCLLMIVLNTITIRLNLSLILALKSGRKSLVFGKTLFLKFLIKLRFLWNLSLEVICLNRNQNSHFAMNPTSIDIQRSSFDRPSTIKTALSAGSIVPYYWDEILPGDTVQIKTSKVIRMPSLVTPIMDNISADFYWFFVPYRLCWDHWKQFMGENTDSAWIPQTQYTMPQIESPEGGWEVGTIADYLGLPTGVDGISVSSLPFRAYSLICNEWFRSENVMDPLNIPLDDSTVVGVNSGNYVTDVAKGGKPFQACKFFDVFTGALPGPQKGNPVTIPVATSEAPVFGNGYNLGLTNGTSVAGLSYVASGNTHLIFSDTAYGVQSPANTGGSGFGSFNPCGMSVVTKELVGSNPEYSGLYASLGDVSVIDINSLRLAFQLQKFLERDARSGSRYIELIKGHFNVTSPDARLQRPEYLGGNRVPITVNQVVQNSATAEGSTPQGNVAGYSLTSDSHGDFIKSFTEHGIIMGLMVIRYDHTYQQGIERAWHRKTREDFYFPVFANLGETYIRNSEIYADGSDKDNEAFGFQERWYEYRYKPNRVTGAMRSAAPQSLDSWHLADDYASCPSLSAEWLREDPSNIDRVLAVSSELAPQFFCDIYVENRSTRPMPMYSIPGLIDHH